MGRRLGGLFERDTDRLLTRLLGVALLLAVVVVVAFALVPFGSGEPYTDFYVLGPDGNASGYPENLTVGESATLRVGIGNFERREMRYTLVVRTNDTTFVTREVALGPEQRWEEPVSVAFDAPGRKRLRLELYDDGTTEGQPYRSLRLIVDVRSA